MPFICNVCSSPNLAGPKTFERETPSCWCCGSNVRFRGVIHVLSERLFGRGLSIRRFPASAKGLKGAGMSDWDGYARRLERVTGYRNSFYHKEPRLDIMRPNPSWECSLDFLISSDVLEHVTPPVDEGFRNCFRLLRPGGVFVLTVPYVTTGETTEHYPELDDFEITHESGRRVLVNHTRDGRTQRFENLVFHGGDGATLEMLLFSLPSLLAHLRNAGFADIHVHDEPVPKRGIHFKEKWSLPISAIRPVEK